MVANGRLMNQFSKKSFRKTSEGFKAWPSQCGIPVPHAAIPKVVTGSEFSQSSSRMTLELHVLALSEPKVV